MLSRNDRTSCWRIGYANGFQRVKTSVVADGSGHSRCQRSKATPQGGAYPDLGSISTGFESSTFVFQSGPSFRQLDVEGAIKSKERYQSA
jgi:hypothetical protein